MIEKFVVSKECSGFTQIANNVLQNFTNIAALGLYCYLISLPADWEITKEQLKHHFNIGRDKIYSLLDALVDAQLMRRETIKNEKGQYMQTRLHLLNGSQFISNKINNIIPLPEKPYTENQELENNHYKEINTKKEKNKTNISCAPAQKNAPDARPITFNDFYMLYPKRKAKAAAVKAWKKIKEEEKPIIMAKLREQLANDVQYRGNKQFIPLPGSYLNGRRWEDEITTNEQLISHEVNKVFSKFNEIRSTVKEWAPGNPDYDRIMAKRAS